MMKPMFFGMICALFLLYAPGMPPQFGHSVMAAVVADASLYNEVGGTGGVCGTVKRGIEVEIVEDRSGLWYMVKAEQDASQGWVEAAALDIPPDEPANRERLDAAVLEAYVNAQGLASATEYLLFTDLDRQQTHVFQGTEGHWVLYKSFPCSTGKNASPTKRGHFVIKMRGDWFYSPRLASGARYWMRFDGPYLYHSLAMNANRGIIDHTLGERVSSGCVRLAVADAQWLYENVPDQTAVFIT